MPGKGAQVLGQTLLVTDVGENTVEYPEPAFPRDRNRYSGLHHHSEQAQRLQGNGLASCVWSGDDQRGRWASDPDFDGNAFDTRFEDQVRMPGFREHRFLIIKAGDETVQLHSKAGLRQHKIHFGKHT